MQPAALDVDAAELRERLVENGYEEGALAALLEAPVEAAASWQGAPVCLEALAGADSAQAMLARLFLLGGAVDAAAAERVLGPRIVRSGLIESAGDDVASPLGARHLRSRHLRSPVLIMPFEGMLFASDPWRRGRVASDVVCPVTKAAQSMSRLTIRRPAGAALDLGAGSGVQGVLAARHSRSVTLTDVNTRALAFSALNARLNGVEDRCELVEGSWFEPVEGREFDLIVSNPPFIVSPDSTYEFRDGGLPGDGVSRLVVREASRHLAEGGFAHVMVNWLHGQEGDWAAPLREWVAGCGCDALLLRFASPSLADYASSWNAPVRDDSEGEFRAALRRWLDHYREIGVEAIGGGLVLLRRRTAGPHWVRALDMPGGLDGPGGAHLERLFANGDWLAADPDDAALLATAFAAPDGLRVRQSLSRDGGRYRRHPAAIRIAPGLGIEATVDPDALAVLLRCDGSRPLGELVDSAGDELKGLVLGAVRELVALALLEPR